MEGPKFSTRAESNLYRSWGVERHRHDQLPEAKLAREAEICYSTIALSTDYDCWHETEEDVTVEAVMAIIRKNVALAQAIVEGRGRAHSARGARCGCTRGGAARGHDRARGDSAAARERLGIIMDKYWSKQQ